MELKGKKIAFLGDSITEGVGVSDREHCRYDNRLKEAYGLSAVYNYGISGTRIAHQRMPSSNPRQDLYFCARAQDLARDADVIVIFGGTNDYGHGDAPFGKIGDDTPATFCGAVEYLLSVLGVTYPAAQLVFMTPARRWGDECARAEKGDEGLPLLAYVDVIKEICARHGVPCVDLYRTMGINPNNEDERERFAPDALHFNDAGHARLAECLMACLNSL